MAKRRQARSWQVYAVKRFSYAGDLFFPWERFRCMNAKLRTPFCGTVLSSKLRGSYILYSCTTKDVTRFVWTFGWAFGVDLSEIFSVVCLPPPTWEVVTLFRLQDATCNLKAAEGLQALVVGFDAGWTICLTSCLAHFSKRIDGSLCEIWSISLSESPRWFD